MNENFFKFPSTPHLATMPGVNVRDDKVMSESERDDFLRHPLIVEEKVDGANLGISFDSQGNIRVQNRGAYLQLPGTGQWKKLESWLTPRIDALFDHLADKRILFGEWCYAQHSVFYGRLPDWFLGFDVYDKQIGRFYSSERRDDCFTQLEIAPVPVLARGHFSFSEVQRCITMSKLGEQSAEGVYLRVEQGDWLVQRAKLVGAGFIQEIEQHWSRFALRPNGLGQE